MTEVKVLMVGPRQAGKSAIANFLADAVQNAERPAAAPTLSTKGVRILEFDRQISTSKSGKSNVSVELWDVSGDRAFEGGWPAIMHGARIVYVYDALSVGQDKDLEEWHRWFGQTIGLKDSQVLIMAHKKEDKKPPKSSTSKSSSLAGLRMVSTTLEENQSNIKDYFDRFLEQVAIAATQKRQNEEDSLLQS